MLSSTFNRFRAMVLRNGSTLSSDWSDLAGDEAATSQAIRVDELDHFDEDWVKPFPLRDGVRIRKGERFSDYYALFEEIGEGKFGKVYRCVEKASNLMLAAKCIKIRKDTDFEKVEKEVNIMTQMRHKCIAQIYDAFATTDNDVILIMEIVEGGELFDRVADDSYILTEMAVALIMFQICEAIRYIHSQHIIHLDLKPENIMCTSQTSNQIKLIDFGLAQWYDGSKDLMFMAGTPEFAAPEVIKYEPLDFHTDMWSLGVIAYILLSGQSPFLGETLAHTYCNVERGNWMFCEEFAENGISSDAKDFISKLLLLDKDRRMLPDECLRHPWIRKNRERAFLASRTASPAVCHPLAVEKFRKYVKNKRFRRLVFGVLFINQVMRMMQTMQRNKSVHGVEYVRNLLVAAESADATDPLNSEKGIGGVNKGEKEAEKGILLSVMDSERKAVEKGADGDGAAKMPGGRKKVVLVKKVPREPGEKKKRSKSEARRAAEQHRTRSSTEQTSNKKQRQEDEVGGGVTEAKSPLLSARRESKSSQEPPTTRRAAAVVKSVKFEEEPSTRDDVPKKVAAGMPVKRVSDGNVLRIAARMFEEHSCCTPSTSAAEKKVPPAQEAATTKKTVSSSNVSALLKKLEQKGQQQGAGGGGRVTTPGRSLSSSTVAATTLQLPFAVTAVAPLKKETATATTRTTGEKGVLGEEKKLKTVRVVKKKVLRLRTAEETEQRQKKRETEQKQKQQQQMTTVKERVAETDETEKMKKVKLRRDAEREEKRPSKKGDDGEQEQRVLAAAVGTALAQNGHGEGTRTWKPELNGVAMTTIKQPQPPKTGLLSPRAKQRLKMSNSFPLGAKGGMNANNNNIREDSAEEMDDAWGVVGQDVFDFSLLRKKLQNRIMGLKDQDDLETEAENQQRFELQKQQKMLRTNLNIKRAMRKWISIDKETKQHQQQHNTDRAPPESFPDWAR